MSVWGLSEPCAVSQGQPECPQKCLPPQLTSRLQKRLGLGKWVPGDSEEEPAASHSTRWETPLSSGPCQSVKTRQARASCPRTRLTPGMEGPQAQQAASPPSTSTAATERWEPREGRSIALRPGSLGHRLAGLAGSPRNHSLCTVLFINRAKHL